MGLFITAAQGARLEKLQSTYKFTARGDIHDGKNIECELVDTLSGKVWHKDMGDTEPNAFAAALASAPVEARIGGSQTVQHSEPKNNKRLAQLEAENAALRAQLAGKSAPAAPAPVPDDAESGEDEEDTDDEPEVVVPPTPPVKPATQPVQRSAPPSITPPVKPAKAPTAPPVKPASSDGAPVKKT